MRSIAREVNEDNVMSIFGVGIRPSIRLTWISVLAVIIFTTIVQTGNAHAQRPELAATPPMGWNTWYAFGCHVTETDVKNAVDALASNGMKASGYEYVNLDDCWQGKRDKEGHIHPSGGRSGSERHLGAKDKPNRPSAGVGQTD